MPVPTLIILSFHLYVRLVRTHKRLKIWTAKRSASKRQSFLNPTRTQPLNNNELALSHNVDSSTGARGLAPQPYLVSRPYEPIRHSMAS